MAMTPLPDLSFYPDVCRSNHFRTFQNPCAQFFHNFERNNLENLKYCTTLTSRHLQNVDPIMIWYFVIDAVPIKTVPAIVRFARVMHGYRSVLYDQKWHDSDVILLP